MAVPQGPMLFKKLEEYPAADNRGENTGKGVQQELHHVRNLLCGSWPTGAPYARSMRKSTIRCLSKALDFVTGNAP